jgi:hypothetical protein
MAVVTPITVTLTTANLTPMGMKRPAPGAPVPPTSGVTGVAGGLEEDTDTIGPKALSSLIWDGYRGAWRKSRRHSNWFFAEASRAALRPGYRDALFDLPEEAVSIGALARLATSVGRSASPITKYVCHGSHYAGLRIDLDAVGVTDGTVAADAVTERSQAAHDL